MNRTVSILYDAADRLSVGHDPTGALGAVVAEMTHQAQAESVDLDRADAAAWLDAAGKVCRALGLSSEADRLHEGRTALADGGIVPSSYYFAWLRALPRVEPTTDAAKVSGNVTRIEIPGLRELVAELRAQRDEPRDMRIVAMPDRIHKLARDKQGKPTGSVETDL